MSATTQPTAGATEHLSAREHLRTLTSLRWFAASLVFLTHTQVLFFGDPPEWWTRIANHGSAGVSFFYILSGFVLAWAWRPGDQARNFYRRRVARIAPAYWVSIVAGVFVTLAVDGFLTKSKILTGAFSLTFLQAWVPDARVYYAVNGVAWSLSDEAFFYALFPIAIVLVLRSKRPEWLLALFVAIALAIPLLLHPDEHTSTVFWATNIFPLARLPEFLAGACMAVLLQQGRRVPIPKTWALGLAVAAWFVCGWTPAWTRSHFITVIPFCLAIFVCAQADITRRPATLLHRPWLIRLGQWSFAFYLVHQMVIRLLTLVAPDHEDLVASFALIALAYIAATVVAYALFRFIEYPLEKRIRHGDMPTILSTRRGGGDGARR